MAVWGTRRTRCTRQPPPARRGCSNAPDSSSNSLSAAPLRTGADRIGPWRARDKSRQLNNRCRLQSLKSESDFYFQQLICSWRHSPTSGAKPIGIRFEGQCGRALALAALAGGGSSSSLSLGGGRSDAAAALANHHRRAVAVTYLLAGDFRRRLVPANRSPPNLFGPIRGAGREQLLELIRSDYSIRTESSALTLSEIVARRLCGLAEHIATSVCRGRQSANSMHASDLPRPIRPSLCPLLPSLPLPPPLSAVAPPDAAAAEKCRPVRTCALTQALVARRSADYMIDHSTL